MIPLLTGEQMRQLDRAAIERYGIPGILLMEHAGLGVARAALRLLGRPGRVVAVCGKGNNGGDGFVAARWLARWGCSVQVLLAGEPEAVSGDAAVQLAIYRQQGLPFRRLVDQDGLAEALAEVDLLLDALLGTGVSGPPRPPLDELVRLMNDAPAPILAVDLPTGTDSDSGARYEPHIRAARTVTFAAWKRGLALGGARVAAGEIELVDIGWPDGLIAGLGELPYQLERSDVQAMLQPRARDAHKGDAGKVVIVGGSAGFGGAAMLAARAAARGGAGLVTLGVPRSLAGMVEAHTVETMSRALPEQDGRLGPAALERLDPLLREADAVGFGPGLGTAEATGELLAELVIRYELPTVIDADGLNLLANQPQLAARKRGEWVLTPHPGEAGRLLGCETAQIQNDRLQAARAIAEKYGATVLLKGAGALIVSPAGQVAVSSRGTPAMASGGMGDALTGLVTALLGQGLSPFEAAQGGAWLHGRAAEMAAGGTDAGLLASDLIESLPRARGELRFAGGE